MHLSESCGDCRLVLLFRTWLHWLLLIAWFFLQINLNLNELLFKRLTLRFLDFLSEPFLPARFHFLSLYSVFVGNKKSFKNLWIKDKFISFISLLLINLLVLFLFPQLLFFHLFFKLLIHKVGDHNFFLLCKITYILHKKTPAFHPI